MRWFPPARRRFERELLRVFPDMPRRERARLSQETGRRMGQTLFEIYHCAEFQTRQDMFTASGPGLAALEEAVQRGRALSSSRAISGSGRPCGPS